MNKLLATTASALSSQRDRSRPEGRGQGANEGTIRMETLWKPYGDPAKFLRSHGQAIPASKHRHTVDVRGNDRDVQRVRNGSDGCNALICVNEASTI